MPCLPERMPTAENALVLVTGASSGIGAAIALRLNTLGYVVIAHGRDVAKLESVKRQASCPARMHLEPRELLTETEGIPQWVSELRSRYGRLAGMAFAAGQTVTMPFMQYDHSCALRLFDLLCHVPLMIAKAVIDRRNCVEQGVSLVFVASAASVAPNKGQLIYGAAKAALVCAARCMSKELAPRGIRVNCISPGLVRTPMLDETSAVLGDSFLQKEEALYPLGLGEPEDVAELAAFLLSPATRWMSGQNIVIDGGRLA